MSEQTIWDSNINDFLEKAKSSEPTPGGGSVSAYSGALAASMVCMVANLTIGKEKYREVEADVSIILNKAEEYMEELKRGLSRDIKVFNQFMDVFKLPKETEEQKKERQKRLQKVLTEATESPMAIAKACYKILELSRELAPIGNKGAISDVGVAAYLAESSLNSAFLSVDINLPQIKDNEYKKRINQECAWLRQNAKILLEQTVRIVQERL